MPDSEIVESPFGATERSTRAAIAAAVRDSDMPRRQKARLLTLLMFPMFCEMLCQDIENKLVAGGTITEAQRWSPETWDWDAVVARIKEMMDYLLEKAPQIIDLIMMVIDLLT